MAKYQVLKTFRDIHTKDVYKKDIEIEMTVKRADEVTKNLDGSYLERTDVKGHEDEEESEGKTYVEQSNDDKEPKKEGK